MIPRDRPCTAAAGLRHARRAWRIQFTDARASLALAERVLATDGAAAEARAWALLARAFHRMRFSTPADALPEFAAADRAFDDLGDRRGQILAAVGRARCLWMQGRFQASLDVLLPLRDEGLRCLHGDERALLLNGLAGCYSALGQPALAFGTMYQGLREGRGRGSLGFDTVLHCNIAHELLLLGDVDEALRHLDEGLRRSATLRNARLESVLRVNRIAALTDLGRPHDALPDIEHLLALPADASGRGASDAGFETMAIAALRAGETALGLDLVARAEQSEPSPGLPDTRVERAVAQAEALRAQGRGDEALKLLEALRLDEEGLGPRERCMTLRLLADLAESLGDSAGALRWLRACQQVQAERSRLASRARQQAAALQTELQRVERERDEIEARRLESERARLALATLSTQLAQQVERVEALQQELRQQAVRDPLTGLHNRRHLNAVLPAMFALARRDGQPLAAVVIDLDHFKQVNDHHGHLAGDELLAAFGRLLGAGLRRSDVACRYGGEEFCLLLPRTAAPAARRKAAALLRQWRAMRFDLGGGIGGLTFSAGVADTSDAAITEPVDLLRAADAAALRAKRSGRARVLGHDDEPAEAG
ncbi:MAG: diguanylate cyclase [Burkholderiaceae bacterium]|nr:diguanylate cyclase [Burkholderiaceae bacterium]